MNPAYYHLVTNHLPILMPVIGVLVLAGGVIFRSPIVKRTAMCLFILGAIAAFAANATGEGAEDVLKELQIADKKAIHIHEEAAETFALVSYLLGALALVALWASWKRKPYADILAVVTLLASGVAFYFGSITGTTGGEVRHTEIRNSVPVVESVEGLNR